jgi:hypothetical protein
MLQPKVEAFRRLEGTFRKIMQMLEYYKLALLSVGNDRALFMQELNSALKELVEPKERDDLRNWAKNLRTES